jgi:hypothetical protein
MTTTIELNEGEIVDFTIDPEAKARLKGQIKDALRPLFDEAVHELVAEVVVPPAAALAHGEGQPHPEPPPPRRRPRRGGSARVRRSPEQLDQVASDVERHVKGHPGQSINEISKAVGVKKPKLRNIIQRLRDENRIVPSGTKVHTRYYAPGAAPKAPAARPGVAKARPRTRHAKAA